MPQAWFGLDGADHVETLLRDLLALAQWPPGFVGFYNGDGAGASIPSHFHFQFFARPAGHEPFPLERATGVSLVETPGQNPVLLSVYNVLAAVEPPGVHELLNQLRSRG